ncbi:hypothetical protein V2J09_021274 [Rumex salicifolius]
MTSSIDTTRPSPVGLTKNKFTYEELAGGSKGFSQGNVLSRGGVRFRPQGSAARGQGDSREEPENGERSGREGVPGRGCITAILCHLLGIVWPVNKGSWSTNLFPITLLSFIFMVSMYCWFAVCFVC